MSATPPIKEPEEALDHDRTPHLSHARIHRYLTCPEQYRLYYLENLRPRVESGAMLFGALIHVALADFFRSGTDPAATFVREWQNLRDVELDYGKRESWETLKTKGETLLAKFLQEEAAKFQAVFGVERKFELSLTSLPLPFVGIVDLIAQVNGRKVIVDFKTAASAYEYHEIALSDQLTAYFLAEPEAEHVSFCVLVKTKEPRIEWHVAKRGASHLVEYLAKVELVAHDIAAGKFYKRPGKWCTSCAFLPVCLGDRKDAERTLVKVGA